MGYIKEPPGIDFAVDPTPLTAEERKRISEIIAHYKATGNIMSITKPSSQIHIRSKRKKILA